jgi:hypothetical protein
MTGIRRVSQLGTTGESTYVDGSIQTVDIAANAVTQAKLSTDIPLSGFRNVLINGGFDVWQRGTSFTGIANTTSYTADRWCIFRSAVAGYSLSQQAMVPSELSGFNYCARYQRTAGNTDLGVLYMGRTFESITVKALAGKTVTLSFYVRKGANFSGSTLSTAVDFGTGTDLGFTTQPTSPSSTTISTTLTASWQYVTSTIAVPTTATAARILFFYTPTGTAGAADYFEITGVQLEVGSQPTPFEQRPYGVELTLCQRYYQIGRLAASGYGIVATIDSGAYGNFSFPTRMRATPTITELTKSLGGSPAGYGSGTTYIDASGFSFRYHHGGSGGGTGSGNLSFDLTWSAASEL